MSDAFNLSRFNTVGELFGSNTPAPARPDRYVTAIPVTGRSAPVARRPQVLSTLAATEPGTTPTADINPDTTRREPLSGTLSGVRAARVSHMYRIDFWDTSGVVEARVAALPVAAVAEDAYQDLLLFNYLPPQITPSADDFATQSDPSTRPVYIKSVLGTAVNPQAGSPPTGPVAQRRADIGRANAVLLAAQTPFADQLRPFCSDTIYNALIVGRGGVSRLQ